MEKRNTVKKISALGLSGALLSCAWTKPVINSVLLPAHAMTSNCSPSDIIGKWTFAFGDPPDALVIIDFFSDGTGELIDGSVVTWALNMDRLIVDVPRIGADSTYDGIMNTNCSIITGKNLRNNDPFTATPFI